MISCWLVNFSYVLFSNFKCFTDCRMLCAFILKAGLRCRFRRCSVGVFNPSEAARLETAIQSASLALSGELRSRNSSGKKQNKKL